MEFRLSKEEINGYLLEAEANIKYAQFCNAIDLSEEELDDYILKAHLAIRDLMMELKVEKMAKTSP
jgi:hypothetical protein